MSCKQSGSRVSLLAKQETGGNNFCAQNRKLQDCYIMQEGKRRQESELEIALAFTTQH